MDERDQNEVLWRSCFLGMRIALNEINTPDTLAKLKECLRLLDAIARNEATLPKLEYDLESFAPQTERLISGIGNQGISSDGDLAALIVTGLNQSAAIAEGSADALPLHSDFSPLRLEEGGALRVGRSRISLDLVVEQYENGMTPEDMVRAYDTLLLPDVHAVIAYYLRHRDEVRSYLRRREEEAAALRSKIEAVCPRVTREDLLARQRAREKDHAPTGQ